MNNRFKIIFSDSQTIIDNLEDKKHRSNVSYRVPSNITSKSDMRVENCHQ